MRSYYVQLGIGKCRYGSPSAIHTLLGQREKALLIGTILLPLP